MKRLVPTPSMAVAMIALLVALSGSAYAVSKVGTKQLKSNAVTTPKIRNGAVTGPKLRSGAVTGAKVANRTLSASKLAPGVASLGGGRTIDSVIATPLTGTFEQVIQRAVTVEAGQTLMGSAALNFYRNGAETNTAAECRMWAAPSFVRKRDPKGFLEISMSPVGVLGLDPDAKAVLPVVGHFDVSSGAVWSVIVRCRRTGTGEVVLDSASLSAWAVTTEPSIAP